MTTERLHRARVFCISFAIGLALPGVAAAQGAAVLTGRITDTAGAPIPGAGVRVPQLERSASADSAGRYRLEGLPTGRFTVIAEARAFAGRRIELTMPASGTVEQEFSLAPNAHVLANIEVRARARRRLELRLHEFEQRRTRAAGRFLGPDDLVRFSGRPLSDALKTIMAGARFQRNAVGELILVSSRQLNPFASRNSANVKPCGIQVWQDGALLSDPNLSVEIMLPPTTNPRPSYSTARIGADHDYDISSLLTNDYAAVEYYPDLASTPPGFRTGTPSCGALVLWSRMPATDDPTRGGQQPR